MLSPVYVIERKRDGYALTEEEIRYLIEGYAAGRIPDYQMAAWAMAVFLRGMDRQEIAHLTRTMVASGDTLRRLDGQLRVDKHSTGGLGDKVSLILAPLLAGAGLHVPMISGRGLGITGGTLDKLEAIPEFRTDLDEVAIEKQLEKIGCVITGASERIVPADKRLYALRDVTATVPSVPLITASILSKKLAESLHALVLDVKFGTGAFMQTEEEARRLAESLVHTGRQLGLATSAWLTDMTQPLGRMIGNANEVYESIEVLRGEGPADVRDLTLLLAAQLLVDVKRAKSLEEARSVLIPILDSGQAYERFQSMVREQGGRIERLPPLANSSPWIADRAGYLTRIDGQRLGHAIIALGGGRQFVGQAIDPVVGLEMLVRIGDSVAAGEPLLNVQHRTINDFEKVMPWLAAAFTIGDEPPPRVPLYQPF